MPKPPPSVPEIFLTALRLGCTSFGGPVAHLAYFRREYVEKRRWLDEANYADLVALCQFLPGPASSQVGFGVGLLQRGLAGGLAAWLGFTLPSALLMIGFGLGLTALGDVAGAGWLQGLKVAAVAVVAHAVVAMARSLCPDWSRALFAGACAGLLLFLPVAWLQIALIAAGLGFGSLWQRGAVLAPRPAAAPAGHAASGAGWLAVFFALLLALPWLTQVTGSDALRLADKFYRAGSLVFGGGHVVLPLLENELVAPGLLTHDAFLAGYGAAQAVPGPLFTFAGYLGATANIGPGGLLGGLWALLWVFAPALLLVLGALPAWQRLRQWPSAQAALRGANAAVVGILLAALIDPVARTGLAGPWHWALGAAGFAVLQFTRLPAWLVVLLAALAGGFLL